MPAKGCAALLLLLPIPWRGAGAVLVRDDGLAFECSLAGGGPLGGTTLAGDAFRASLNAVTWIAGREQRRVRLRDGSLIRVRTFDEQSLTCEASAGNLAVFAAQIVFYFGGEVNLSRLERLVLVESGGRLQVTPHLRAEGQPAPATVYLLPEDWDENSGIRLSDAVYTPGGPNNPPKVRFSIAIDPKQRTADSYQLTVLRLGRAVAQPAPAVSPQVKAPARLQESPAAAGWKGWEVWSQPLGGLLTATTGTRQSVEVSLGALFAASETAGEGDLYLYVTKGNQPDRFPNVVLEQTAGNVLAVPAAAGKAGSRAQ